MNVGDKMKITKYAQSCIRIDTKQTRILIDPGMVEYTPQLLETDWVNIDIILVTHKHMDHCNQEAINTIIERDHAKLYTSKEVEDTYQFENCQIVNENDTISVNGIKIEVAKAVHGYLSGMHENGIEIMENIGFIIDDGKTRIYITSDTISFYNQYQCDVICAPFNGNGLTLGIVDGIDFIKHTKAKLVLPVHNKPPRVDMIPDFSRLSQALQKEDIHYKILEDYESFEI